MKKALRETQTLRAGCSKAEPKKNHPAADPLPGGAGRPKFNQLETDGLYLQTQFGEESMHAISSYRANRPTPPFPHTQAHPPSHPPRHKQTYRTDYNTLRRS